MKRLAIVLMAGLLAGCGGRSSPMSPSPVNAAGVWTGTAVLSAVSGGECVGAALDAAIGRPMSITAQITQSGSQLEATVTEPGFGGSAQYTGTAGTSTIALTLQASATGSDLGLQCANGARRDVILQGASAQATVSGPSMTGTASTTSNVFISGTTVPVGSLTYSYSLQLTRQ